MHRAAVIIALALAGCRPGSAAPSPAPKPGRDAAPPNTGPPNTGPPNTGPHDAGVDADLRGLSGKPLYVALCAPCHGADGHGYAADHAPSLVSSTFLESADDGFLQRSIAMGRPGTSMAAYARAQGGPLDPAGIASLVQFLRAQGPAAVPLLAMATGDPALGAAIYAQRCLSCHGDTRARGEAISLANPQLLGAATNSFLRYAIAGGRPGTKMIAFAGELSSAEIDAVVAYIRSFADAAPTETLLPPPTGKEPLVLNPSGKAPKFTLRADPCPAPPPVAPGSPAAPAPPLAPLPPCTLDPRFVSVAKVAAALAARQRIVIIDARPPSEWMRVHIAGAVSIPYHDLARLDELPRDGTWIVAYCACPHHLSGIVVDELRKRGFAHSAVLDEGINDWHRRGFPVVAAAGVTKPLPEPAASPSGRPSFPPSPPPPVRSVPPPVPPAKSSGGTP
ncbi:MAG TPA: c-type cytochrome [Kofleriaceae bacterium]|nr:c-type cytochrome [Kofleriaceae bacterium]